MNTPTTETVRIVAEESLRLALVIGTAEEIQWEASPVPKPREDTTQRATGGHGDPTGNIVLDARRLAVRDAVKEAERVLALYSLELRNARLKLDDAVTAWNGE
jgi:hypothetical protein